MLLGVGIPNDHAEMVRKGVENEWINSVSVYGLNRANKYEVRLRFDIDWAEKAIQVKLYGDKVVFGPEYQNEEAPELAVAKARYLRLCEERGLVNKLLWSYHAMAPSNAGYLLGGVDSTFPEAAMELTESELGIEELPEVKIRVYEPRDASKDGKKR
jgi:hypothetical protein